jgi:hypothetical protein
VDSLYLKSDLKFSLVSFPGLKGMEEGTAYKTEAAVGQIEAALLPAQSMPEVSQKPELSSGRSFCLTALVFKETKNK